MKTNVMCANETSKNYVKDLEKSNIHILRERLEAYGVDYLLEEEILSLLTGISLDTVKKAINDFGLPELIKYVDSMDLTKAQYRKLELLHQFHKKMKMAEHKIKPILNTSSKAGQYCLNLFIGKSYEEFYILCLDSQSHINHHVLISSGTIGEAPVYPRLIVEAALKYRASSVVLCHNHPGTFPSSGSTLRPSQADINLTSRIHTALSTIQISVVDHIIVAGDGLSYYSFAEKGIMPT
jgi:DNA repair protein RadC